MRMITRLTLMITAALFMLSTLANADEGKPAIPGLSAPGPDKTMQPENQKYAQNVKEAVDIKNITEIFNQAPIRVDYDEEGRISSIYLENGEQVKYSYGYDEDGNLSRVTLSGDNLELSFTLSEDGHGKFDATQSLIGDPAKFPDEDKEPDINRVTIYVPGDTLTQIARRPVDFNKIRDGLNEALEERNKAYEEYLKNTTPYYEKVLNELVSSADGLGAEGIKLDIKANDRNPGGSIDAKQRKNVDEAVQAIYQKAKEGRGQARQAERFLAVERILADEFLSANRQIFEDKIKNAVQYVNKIIDEVIKSKLAVYLNVDKDKIEAIVNLPEAKK